MKVYKPMRAVTHHAAFTHACTQRPVIEVVSRSSVPVVPKIGDVITGKVLRVQQNAANCKIVCVGTRALDVDFRGVIRWAHGQTTSPSQSGTIAYCTADARCINWGLGIRLWALTATFLLGTADYLM